MAERQDKSLGQPAQPENGADPPEQAAGQAAPSDTAAAGTDKAATASGLPAVEGPKLGDGEPEGPDEDSFFAIPAFNFSSAGSDYGGQDGTFRWFGPSCAPAAPRRSYRFALLAAVIALAAGIGAAAGALTTAGFMRPTASGAAAAATANARNLTAARRQVAELSALKRRIDSAARSANSQFARINERVNSLRRTEADHAAKLAQIAASIDKLGRSAKTAPEITGSIASAPRRPAPILSDWVVQEVHRGRALVQSRYGGYFLVGAGDMLPGLGRVETVKRQGGQWIVVTTGGVIASAH